MISHCKLENNGTREVASLLELLISLKFSSIFKKNIGTIGNLLMKDVFTFGDSPQSINKELSQYLHDACISNSSLGCEHLEYFSLSHAH